MTTKISTTSKSHKKGDLLPYEPEFIPPGEYEGICIDHCKFTDRGCLPKLCLTWKVEVMNDQCVTLPQYFNLCHKVFKDRTKYCTAYIIANDCRKPLKRKIELMSPKIFLGIRGRLSVTTVVPKFDNGEDKPSCFHYSKVHELLEKLGREHV